MRTSSDFIGRCVRMPSTISSSSTIFLNAGHVRSVAREFIEYYNRARPSQATHAIPDPYPELIDRPLAGGKRVALPVLGGVQHDYRLAA